MDPKISIINQQNTTNISIHEISVVPVVAITFDTYVSNVKFVSSESTQKINIIESSGAEVITNTMDEDTNSAALGLKGAFTSEQEWTESIKKHVCEQYTWDKNEW